MKNNFGFFMPAEIVKSKDKDGVEKMQIAGIASTTDEDTDEEILLPKGFDLSYFTESGFVNWHHRQKDKPSAIIGEPSAAKIISGGKQMHVVCDLYNTPLAKEVYDLGIVLQNQSTSGRRLGFSIEGKVLERDKNNPRIVTKAAITGCAITYQPKNKATIAEIVKADGTTPDVDLTPDMDGLLEDLKLMKAAGASSEEILKACSSDLDAQSFEGEIKKVEGEDEEDEEKEEVVEKAGKYTSKHVNAAGKWVYVYQHPKKEIKTRIIDADIRNLRIERDRIESEQENDQDVLDNVTDGTHPAVAHYGKLLSAIDNKIHKLQLKKTKYADRHVEGEVVGRSLLEAWRKLGGKVEKGLDAGSSSGQAIAPSSVDGKLKDNRPGFLSKAHIEGFMLASGIEVPTDDFINFVLKVKNHDAMANQNSTADTITKADMDAALGLLEKAKTYKAEDEQPDELDPEEDDDEKENEKDDDGDEVEKGFNSSEFGINRDADLTIEKAVKQLATNYSTGFGAIETLFKGLQSELQKSQEETALLRTRLDEIDNAPATGRKALTHQRAAQPIEKAFDLADADAGGTGKQVRQLSISRNKGAICAELEKMAFPAEGFNEPFAKAMTVFESSSNLEPLAVEGLRKLGFEIIA